MPNTKLSSVDYQLIALLQKNARTTNKDLAKAVGIAESTCLDRVRSLRERGVIRGWHADADLRALGRSIRALISVRLQPKSTESVEAFEREVLAAAETVSLYTVSGADDFIVEVAVPDVEHLRRFVLDAITSRSQVADARTSLVYDHGRKHLLGPMPVTT